MQSRYSFFIFTFFAALLFSCKEELKQEETIRPVRWESIKSMNQVQAQTLSGFAQAQNETKLSFKVAGKLTQLRVKIGDKVNRGSLIASLDPTDLQLQLEQSLAQQTSAKAQYLSTKSSFGRMEILYENNSISLNDYESAKAQYENAEAQLNAGNKQVEAARNQVAYTRLTAPFTGVISSVMVKANELVASGTVVAVISSDEQLEVRVPVPEKLIYTLEKGQKVGVRFPVLEGKSFRGIITEVSFVADQSSTYPVIVRLEKASDQIRPGMPANVTLTAADSALVNASPIIAPFKAVGEDATGNFVYVIETQDSDIGTVRKQSIEIGKLLSNGFEVIQGLTEGQRVATAGLKSLFDGMKVKLLAN